MLYKKFKISISINTYQHKRHWPVIAIMSTNTDTDHGRAVLFSLHAHDDWNGCARHVVVGIQHLKCTSAKRYSCDMNSSTSRIMG
jgi:hypothetical protein